MNGLTSAEVDSRLAVAAAKERHMQGPKRDAILGYITGLFC